MTRLPQVATDPVSVSVTDRSVKPLTSADISWAGLAWTLVRTDFKTRYHGAWSGFAWALLKPAAMFGVLVSVFSLLFPDPGYKFELVIALFLWDFFADGTKTGLASLHAKAYLFKKMRVPLAVVVLASLANPLITLAVFSGVILAFLAVAGSPPSLIAVGLFGLYCAALVLMVASFSLAASVLFLKYRDLNQLWDLTVQAGFFIAPIVYPLGLVPERLHFYFYLWPPTPIIQFSRSVLIGGTLPTPTAHFYLAAEVVILLAVGVAIFRRYSPRAAEFV